MVSAELRTHRSGRSFDLKFYNPTPELYEELISFLSRKKQIHWLSGNYAAGKDGVCTAFGFESVAGSIEKNYKLIDSIKQFCKEKNIEYKQSILAATSDDESVQHAEA